MTTATVEVQGLFTAECGLGVEKRLLKLARVRRASVNPVSGTATVEYDERAIKLEVIKAAVRDCGYGCTERQLPHHVCGPEDDPPPGAVASFAGAVHRTAASASFTLELAALVLFSAAFAGQAPWRGMARVSLALSPLAAAASATLLVAVLIGWQLAFPRSR